MPLFLSAGPVSFRAQVSVSLRIKNEIKKKRRIMYHGNDMCIEFIMQCDPFVA